MVRRLGLGKNNHLTYASLALNPRYVFYGEIRKYPRIIIKHSLTSPMDVIQQYLGLFSMSNCFFQDQLQCYLLLLEPRRKLFSISNCLRSVLCKKFCLSIKLKKKTIKKSSIKLKGSLRIVSISIKRNRYNFREGIGLPPLFDCVGV